jgi:hypothetical protein
MASLLPYNSVLGHRLAKHILRRSSYQQPKFNIYSVAAKTADQAIEDLFVSSTHTVPEPIDADTLDRFISLGIGSISTNFELKPYIAAWWIEKAMLDLSIVIAPALSKRPI